MMTIRELYEWAVEQGAEDFEVKVALDGGYMNLDDIFPYIETKAFTDEPSYVVL